MLVAVVREGLVSVFRGGCAQDPGVGEENVEDQLSVQSPVAGIMEDEYCIDPEAGGRRAGVDWARERAREPAVVGAEDIGEGPDFRVGDEDVARSDDVLEAIALGDEATFIGFAAHYENGGICLETAAITGRVLWEGVKEIGNRGVRLDETLCSDGCRKGERSG